MKILNPLFDSPLPEIEKLDIPYAWKTKGQQKGPTVTVLGGVHGNETVGVDVVQNLLEIMRKGGVQAGVLQVALGNIEGYKREKRFVEKDLNRCFDNPTGNSIEEIRARELIPILKQTDVLFDVHGTIKPSEPFIGSPNPNHQYGWIIPYMGIPTIVTGEGYAPKGKPIYSDALVAESGGLGITIESGWIENPDVGKIQENIHAALAMLGIFKKPEETIEPIQAETWNAYWNVVATEGFEFTKEWQNFEKMPAGTIFARDPSGQGDMKTSEDSIILFPKSKTNLVVGNEACIIAKKIF